MKSIQIKRNRLLKIFKQVKSIKSFRIGKPKSVDLLYFDARSAAWFDQTHFQGLSSGYLDSTLTEINIPAMVRALVRKGLGIRLEDYLFYYIEMADPRVCLVYTEHSMQFYNLKKRMPYRAFVAVIFGVPYGHYWDFQEYRRDKPKKHVCDYLISSSRDTSELVSKHIQAKFLNYGNLRLNEFGIKHETAPRNGICYISEWRHNSSKDNLLAQSTCLRILSEFAKRIELPLSIALSSNRLDKFLDLDQEKKFFLDICPHFCFSKENSYSFSSKYRVVVSLVSDLGNELISLGYRVFFIDYLSHVVPLDPSQSVEPSPNVQKIFFSYHWGDSGPFWTSGKCRAELEEKLLNIYNMTDDEWAQVRSRYVMPIEYFDFGNNKFKSLIRSLV